jgi:hypothetical protein
MSLLMSMTKSLRDVDAESCWRRCYRVMSAMARPWRDVDAELCQQWYCRVMLVMALLRWLGHDAM